LKWAGIGNILILHKWLQTPVISSGLGNSFFFMSCCSKEISELVCSCGRGITFHVVRDDDMCSNKFLQLAVNVCVDVMLYCNELVLNCAVNVEKYL